MNKQKKENCDEMVISTPLLALSLLAASVFLLIEVAIIQLQLTDMLKMEIAWKS